MAGRDASNIPLMASDGGDQAIARAATGIAAFVGRTLKGPVHRPVRVGSFAEFQRCFGGLWLPSTLSYAVEQYFESGGREAFIVRVANAARPPTLTLPAGTGTLALIGCNPGSREYLRAAIDYDGIGAADPDRFNLVVQRVRLPGSELIEDQETFRRVSVEPDAPRFIGTLLSESRLVRLAGALPRCRPECTAGGSAHSVVGYVNSNQDGDDGAPLSDYDVIGSAVEATGLHALRAEDRFDLLCIPPLAREQDVGLPTLLVATRFCRERRAVLVVDPPAVWRSAEEARAAMRGWPFRSENAVMFFPRIIAFDRLRKRPEVFGSAAVAAGMIARGDATSPVWGCRESEEATLRPAFRRAFEVTEAERSRLANAGVNTLQPGRGPPLPRLAWCTLAAGATQSAQGKFLAARRLELFVCASIERGTQWLLSAPSVPQTWARAQRQVEQFLSGLERDGAFAGARPQDSYFVICDERVNRPDTVAEARINLLFGFASARPADFQAWLVSYQAGRTRMRPIAVNRLATSAQRVEWEIETAILRS